jgi:tetratricopeptide (TPR) repeat protein
MKTIEKRSIKTPIIYFHCLKFAEDMLDDDDLIQALDFLLERFSDSMQTDSRWRLLLEIGLVYQRLKQTKQAQRCLSTALELAPNLLKLKVYLAILRIVGKKPEPLRISQVILDINRDRFVNGQAAVSYAFQEWKYYFHYSLFYLVNRD